MQPKIHIRYAPGPGGLLSALFYLESRDDIYGWHMESGSRRFSAAFFMLECFYAPHNTSLYRSMEDDVYGPWLPAAPLSSASVRSPLPEPVRHELERLQSEFIEDWLVFDDNQAAEQEASILRARGLTPMVVNLRARRFPKLERVEDGWEHVSPGADRNIMEFLTKRWRDLDAQVRNANRIPARPA
jgi:hypothetical protein